MMWLGPTQSHWFLLLCLCYSTIIAPVWSDDQPNLPTLYEHFTSGGIHSGLEANHADHFTLNGKPLVLYSGTLHYFRLVPEHWARTLTQYKAAGLNAVQLYLPWNQHEPTPGHFDFESPMLNLEKFLGMIKQADMFAIVRPGPYICAEWEFGGLPSWLLHDHHMSVRSSYAGYLTRVDSYWAHALQLLNKHLFATGGGPVIALQLENEYSQYLHSVHGAEDYYRYLYNRTVTSGYKGLVFASDPTGQLFPIKGIFPHDSVLQTLNMNRAVANSIARLKTRQLNKPGYISEFWTGWFDRWRGGHHTDYGVKDLLHEMNETLFAQNGSLNLYPFIGGTNFGFMNGRLVTTSWDFDAPLTINGHYTEKYHNTRTLYQRLVESGRHPRVRLPPVPEQPKVRAYERVSLTEYLPFEEILKRAVRHENLTAPMSMESLPVAKDHGQLYGFVNYRVHGSYQGNQSGHHQFEVIGRVHHRGILLVNQTEVSVLEECTYFAHAMESSPTGPTTFDLLVENTGRTTGGVPAMNTDRTGLSADDLLKAPPRLVLDGHSIKNVTAYSLDFKPGFIESLKEGWQKLTDAGHHATAAPGLYRGELKVDGEPEDTFVLLPGWTKGNLFVNGFNLGRYWAVGPQQTLYLPGPLLRKGLNRLDIFELHRPGTEVTFTDRMVWSTPNQ